jgi:hypothetical protein
MKSVIARRIRILVSLALGAGALACSPDRTGAPSPLASLPDPVGDEVPIRVAAVMPAGATLPDSIRLVAGIHATATRGDEGGVNLDPERVQLLSILTEDGRPLLAGVVIGAPANSSTLSLTARTTAEALVFLSPLLATSSPDAAGQVLSAIRGAPALSALLTEVESALRERGTITGDPADQASIASRVAAVVEQVVAARGLRQGSADSRRSAVRLGGSLVQLPGASVDWTASSVTVTNERARWVSVVQRYSTDGETFPEVAGGAWPPDNLISSPSLLGLVTPPSRTFARVPGRAATQVKVFGPGVGNIGVALDDPDVGAVVAPLVATAIFDFIIPIIEIISGAEVPAASASSVLLGWISGTTLCLTGEATGQPLTSPIVTTIAEGLLGGDDPPHAVTGLLFPALRCTLEAFVDDPDLARRALGLSASSAATALLNNSLVWLRVGFLIYDGADIAASAWAVAASDVLLVTTIVEPGVIRTGNAQIPGRVINALNGAPIAGATVRLGNSGQPPAATVTTSADGAFLFPTLGAGEYLVEATATGFKSNTADNVRVVKLPVGDVARVDFALPPVTATQPFGGFSGRVITAGGVAIGGADVVLSGGAQTNGVFRATKTSSDGTYAITGVVLDDADGDPIETFTVEASAVGFVSVAREVELVENQTTTNVDFSLAAGVGSGVLYAEGFESPSAWTATGLWNRNTLAGLRNLAVPTYVSLAPGDASAGALPAPPEGEWAFWYGAASTGNFIGTQASNDSPGSGGRSTGANSGSLTSPEILIPAGTGAVTLRFETWFEIESVNPNANGYDLMQVQLVNASTGAVMTLGRLNPFVDPTLANRNAIPFTSGGFNQVPVWRPAEADLSAYRGQRVRIRFTFDTRDGLYNGFRGWLVDRIRVSEDAAGGGGARVEGVLRINCDAGCAAPTGSRPPPG